MAIESTTTTFVHLEYVPGQLEVTIHSPEHCAHVLTIRETCGCHICVFMTDAQLRQLLGAINERLELVSVDDTAKLAGEVIFDVRR